MNNVSMAVSTTEVHDVEIALVSGLGAILGTEVPRQLLEAIHHAVLAGGSRFRPRLLLAVAESIGPYDRSFALNAGAAIELLHAASLVHDDLPAFDDAKSRRGAPSVHHKFGEALAILAGDALIVGAYELLHLGTRHHARCHDAMHVMFRAGGAAEGLAKGQALELLPCETPQALARYQRAKTGVLFEAATTFAAYAADADPCPWVAVGAELGALYQAIDDVLDVYGDPTLLGKEVGKDASLGRPSTVPVPPSGPRMGAEVAARLLGDQIERVRASIPAHAAPLRDFVETLIDETQSRLLT